MTAYRLTIPETAIGQSRDLVELVAPNPGTLRVKGFDLGQITDYGDAQAEGLAIDWIRGHTTSGSGGNASVALVRNDPDTLVATVTAETVNTTVASGGSPETLFSDAWVLGIGYSSGEIPEDMIVVRNGGRLVLRVSSPNDSYTARGTVRVEIN